MVDGGPAKVDGLPAKGAVGYPIPNVVEALPADGVLVVADEGGEPPISIVGVGADGALFLIF